jgi:hypothetical protein
MVRAGRIAAAALALTFFAGASQAQQAPGVVSNIKVLMAGWPDVPSLEDWKKTYIKDGMSDKDKALAIFNAQVTFQNPDAPPAEYLQREDTVLDPIKTYNVYGYTLCSISAANMACMGRYAGMPAKNTTIQNHVIPEFFYDGAWHMYDADLVQYFPKADGSVASLDEIVAGIQAWLKDHPDFSVEPGKKSERYKWMNANGWKSGPEILSRCPFFDENGWLPCTDFAWGDTMQQFSKVSNTWQSCYSMGYRVNVQLRVGETLTRNWFNKGMHVNMPGPAPASLAGVPGKGEMKYTPRWGDIAPGRVGNGSLVYDVPLATGEFRVGALQVMNLAAKSEDQAAPAVHVKDPAQAAVLDIRMPSSYVYLGGAAELKAVVGAGGSIRVLFSDNNGLDWKDVATLDKTGDEKLDLKPLVFRRYVYILRFVMKGAGTGLDALRISNDIQHSQRPLPALVQGENKIKFSAGAQEGTITIEGAMDHGLKFDKQLTYADFHPTVEGMDLGKMPKGDGKPFALTFPVKTPGDMTRLRLSDYFLSQGKDSFVLIDVSFDDGKTWRNVDTPTEKDLGVGPRFYCGRYAVVSDVPPQTRSAQVRYRSVGVNTVAVCNARIDADYKEPAGGFRPVQVTYVWEEGGLDKRNVHVAKSPEEDYVIKCDATPTMKSLILELAK